VNARRRVVVIAGRRVVVIAERGRVANPQLPGLGWGGQSDSPPLALLFHSFIYLN